MTHSGNVSERWRTLPAAQQPDWPDKAQLSEVAAVLSTADVGISPDPKNPLNDVSTMNKTMEYMAFGLPVVAFDLRETRVSAGEAGLYATPNDVRELARLIVELVDDEPRRRAMGEFGRRRVEQELTWDHQAGRYLAVYDGLVGGPPRTVEVDEPVEIDEPAAATVARAG